MTYRKFFLSVKTFLPAILSLMILSVAIAWGQDMAVTKPTQPAASAPPQSSKDAAPDIANPPLTQEHPDLSTPPKTIEDITTPFLKGSELTPNAPFVIEEDRLPTYRREMVRVVWRRMDPIDLYIVKPVGVKNPPVVLYLYSYPSETDRFLKDDFCKYLVQGGYAAIGFASAMNGQRYHDVPFTEWFVSDLPDALAVTAHDVQMILNYLESRHDFDMERVGMFGDGSGATVAILAAAADPRIKTLNLLDPWGDWPDWIAKSTLIPEKERPDYLKPEFLKSIEPLDPLKWLPQLKTQKILIQDVKTVTVTPEDARKKIEAIAPPNVEIRRYDDVQAFLKTASSNTGFNWVKEHLPSMPPVPFRANSDPQSENPADNAQLSHP
jgi:hypothetical protein